MNTFQRSDINSILNNIAQALDISDRLFEEATEKYRSVGTWLGEGNSPFAILFTRNLSTRFFWVGHACKTLR